jgi:predicted nucleic acid-binding protein
MRIFLDANILVTVVNREYPRFTTCAKLLSLADEPGFSLFTSSLSLAITWYFAGKKSGEEVARKKIKLLLEHIQISPCGPEEVALAIQQPGQLDFEDVLQYQSAKSAKCQAIVSSNASDFFFSDIPVSDPDAFFRFLK